MPACDERTDEQTDRAATSVSRCALLTDKFRGPRMSGLREWMRKNATVGRIWHRAEEREMGGRNGRGSGTEEVAWRQGMGCVEKRNWAEGKGVLVLQNEPHPPMNQNVNFTI